MKYTKKRPLLKLTTFLAASVIVGLIAGCGKKSDTETTAMEAEGADKTARLTYVNWAEGVAYTHLAKVVLEDMMGYDVEITSADVGPAYIAVADRKYDAFMECWPKMHRDYLEAAGDDVISLGNVYEGTELGLAVPAYVPIDTISGIKGNEDKFDGKITGIDAGAGMMKTIEAEIIPDYDLDITLVPSSGPAMTAAVSDAVDSKEWILFPAWKPHWMFASWDLKLLEQDPDKAVWERGNIEIIGRADIDEDKPELAQFLRNMYLTDPELADLMLKVEESDDSVEEVARNWMNDHEEVVMDWIP